MANLFTVFNRNEQTAILANYMPNDDVFAGKINETTKLFKFLFGFSETNRRINESLEVTFDEYDFRITTDFLGEWESMLGIPDSCFPGSGTIAQRRIDVIAKFLADGTQTTDDFKAIAALYGIVINIKSGISEVDVFPFTFPIVFPDVKTARFTMIIEFVVEETLRFPLIFPIPFGDNDITKLECLFRKLAPANVDVIFRQI